MQDEKVQSDWVKSTLLAEELQAAEFGFTDASKTDTVSTQPCQDVGHEAVMHTKDETRSEVMESGTSEEAASDLEIAMMLQAQFNDEYEQEVSDREFQANKQLGNKVSLSLDLYRLSGQQLREQPADMEVALSIFNICACVLSWILVGTSLLDVREFVGVCACVSRYAFVSDFKSVVLCSVINMVLLYPSRH